MSLEKEPAGAFNKAQRLIEFSSHIPIFRQMQAAQRLFRLTQSEVGILNTSNSNALSRYRSWSRTIASVLDREGRGRQIDVEEQAVTEQTLPMRVRGTPQAFASAPAAIFKGTGN
jgi:hypothetical protein